MSEQIENLYKLMTLHRLLADFNERLEDYAASVDNLRERFLFPERAFRFKGEMSGGPPYYKPGRWHLQDPAHELSTYMTSCCRRGNYEIRTVEFKNLSDMTDDDRLCSICFRPILRPKEE